MPSDEGDTEPRPAKLSVAAEDLGERVEEVLQWVQRAEVVMVTRAGTPVAAVVPWNGGWVNNRAQVDDFLARGGGEHSDWLAEIEADRRAEG